jgi:hypothetical protein
MRTHTQATSYFVDSLTNSTQIFENMQSAMMTKNALRAVSVKSNRTNMSTKVQATSRVDRCSKDEIMVAPSILSANFARLGEQVRLYVSSTGLSVSWQGSVTCLFPSERLSPRTRGCGALIFVLLSIDEWIVPNDNVSAGRVELPAGNSLCGKDPRKRRGAHSYPLSRFLLALG